MEQSRQEDLSTMEASSHMTSHKILARRVTVTSVVVRPGSWMSITRMVQARMYYLNNDCDESGLGSLGYIYETASGSY